LSILVTGLSTRAIAESAVHGGHAVITLDYFGDLDQKGLVENYSLKRDFQFRFSAEGLQQASRHLDYQAVVYISNLENHPGVVAELARGRVLLGNAPAVLRQVRDWRALRQFCQETNIPHPITLLPGEEKEADPTVCWLRKPVRSGGGHGIKVWAGDPLDEAHILQAYVEGQPASVAFVADAQRSVLLGLTEQLIGQDELGSRRFAWCGNILPLEIQSRDWLAVLKDVEEMVTQLTRRFSLRGVNGIDLVMAEGPDGQAQPTLVEINPRYTASMELVERAYGINVFSAHIEAMSGRLPDFSLAEQGAGPYLGKSIVYARQAVTLPETAEWTQRDRRDVPFPGEQIEAGHPVCTVLAEGNGRETCWARLLENAKAVRQEIGDNDK
jgi:predicted ATP-grasp superfamily ATP-dependent carboligase